MTTVNLTFCDFVIVISANNKYLLYFINLLFYIIRPPTAIELRSPVFNPGSGELTIVYWVMA